MNPPIQTYYVVKTAYQLAYPVVHAVSCNNFEACYLLIQAGWDPAVPDNQALHIACINGCLDIVALLLSHKNIDPSLPNNHALKLAIHYDNIDVVRLLLADIRVCSMLDNTCIRYAVNLNRTIILALMLNRAQIAIEIETVSEAAKLGKTSIVNILTRLPIAGW